MRKNRAILLTGIFLIIILIVFGMLIKEKVPNNIFSFLDIGTYRIPPKSIEVNSSNVIGQSFVSNFNNLFMMSIFIPTWDLNRDGQLHFHLKNNKNDTRDLVTLKWKFNEIRFAEKNFYVVPPDRESTERGFHFHFQFAPIPNSKGKEFYFYFDSPDTKPGEGIKVGIWDNIDYYEALTKGQAFVNNKPVKSFLAFRTYNTWVSNISDLVKEIKDRLFQDKQFLIFYCGLSFVILTSLIITFAKRWA
jgi:hypothetical protein